MSYQTKFHHDGTVTVWDVYTQQWDRRSASDIYSEHASNRIMDTLNDADRERIEALANGHTLTQERKIARAIIRAADEGGIIQAAQMLDFTHEPTMHTTCRMEHALRHCGVYHAARRVADFDLPL